MAKCQQMQFKSARVTSLGAQLKLLENWMLALQPVWAKVERQGRLQRRDMLPKRRRLNTPQQSTAPQSQPIRSRAEPLRPSTSTAHTPTPISLQWHRSAHDHTPGSVSAAPAQKASVTGQALRVQLKQPQSSAGQVAPQPSVHPSPGCRRWARQTHPVSFQGSCQYTASILARSQHCPAISGSW